MKKQEQIILWVAVGLAGAALLVAFGVFAIGSQAIRETNSKVKTTMKATKGIIEHLEAQAVEAKPEPEAEDAGIAEVEALAENQA